MSLLTVQLPSKGRVLVTSGQPVSVGDLLAKGESFRSTSLNIARLLKVKPQKVKKLLLKKIGDEVKEGEIIAQKSSLFSKSKLKSPQSGILESLDEGTGLITIKSSFEDFSIKAPVSGKVAKVKDGEEVVIEFEGVDIEAQKGVGSKKEGKIVVFKSPQASLFDLSLDLAGKIVAAKTWSSGSLSKAKVLGIEAVLAEQIEDEDLERLASGEDLSMGKWDIALLIFSPENFAKVVKCDGKQAIVWGEGKRLFVSSK